MSSTFDLRREYLKTVRKYVQFAILTVTFCKYVLNMLAVLFRVGVNIFKDEFRAWQTKWSFLIFTFERVGARWNTWLSWAQCDVQGLFSGWHGTNLASFVLKTTRQSGNGMDYSTEIRYCRDVNSWYITVNGVYMSSTRTQST